MEDQSNFINTINNGLKLTKWVRFVGRRLINRYGETHQLVSGRTVNGKLH